MTGFMIWDNVCGLFSQEIYSSKEDAQLHFMGDGQEIISIQEAIKRLADSNCHLLRQVQDMALSPSLYQEFKFGPNGD